MSASRGHGFTIDEALEAAGVDPIRHALAAMNPETADAEFTWERQAELTRSGLLGEIANPAHRVATLLWRRFGGRVDPRAWESDARLDRETAASALGRAGALIRRGELRAALTEVHELGRTVNRRLAATEPWSLPDPDAHRELTRLVPYLDALGVAAWPFVPETAGRVRAALGRTPAPPRWALEADPPSARQPPEPPLRLPGQNAPVA